MQCKMESSIGPGWIVPDWPVPSWIKAGSTTRTGGVSLPPYNSLNLGDHVGDELELVKHNRSLLKETRKLPAEPVWLQQVHGIEVVDATFAKGVPIADASYTSKQEVVCVVMTADCLPVLLADEEGRHIAAIHAGWRGLADGVIEATVKQMGSSASKLMAWLGPAIGPKAFEVGGEVREIFLSQDSVAKSAFIPSSNDRWLADLYTLAHQRLRALGLEKVYGGHWCTFSEKERFYSYRRDGVTGRMATFIWIEQS